MISCCRCRHVSAEILSAARKRFARTFCTVIVFFHFFVTIIIIITIIIINANQKVRYNIKKYAQKKKRLAFYIPRIYESSNRNSAKKEKKNEQLICNTCTGQIPKSIKESLDRYLKKIAISVIRTNKSLQNKFLFIFFYWLGRIFFIAVPNERKSVSKSAKSMGTLFLAPENSLSIVANFHLQRQIQSHPVSGSEKTQFNFPRCTSVSRAVWFDFPLSRYPTCYRARIKKKLFLSFT